MKLDLPAGVDVETTDRDPALALEARQAIQYRTPPLWILARAQLALGLGAEDVLDVPAEALVRRLTLGVELDDVLQPFVLDLAEIRRARLGLGRHDLDLTQRG